MSGFLDSTVSRAAEGRRHLASLAVLACALLLSQTGALASWVPVSDVSVANESVDYGGDSLIISYSLKAPDLSPSAPAYVFVRYSTDGGANWALAPATQLRGTGHGIVSQGGRQTIRWWGSDQLGLTAQGINLKIAVRAIRMARVPSGALLAKMIPGGGLDQSKAPIEEVTLGTYYMATFETTVSMYADYLNEVGRGGRGWNSLMAKPDQCGILRQEGDKYAVVPGREDFPVNYVSYYESQAFLEWCGLRLPSEIEFLKAFRGGIHLDGDELKSTKNPHPERKFPWGDETPETSGLLRCNFYINDRKRAPQTAVVGSYSAFNSPYGISDLAGNVAEWTRDRHSTAYHDSIGIDGYRMLKGGSYLDPWVGCDAVAGASQLPTKRGSSVGFRAVYDNSHGTQQ